MARAGVNCVPDPVCKRNGSFKTIDMWTVTYDVSSLKGCIRSFVIHNRYTLPISGMNDYARNDPSPACVRIGSEKHDFETKGELDGILNAIFRMPTECEKRNAELDQHIKIIKQRRMEEDKAAVWRSLDSTNDELERVIRQIIQAMRTAQIYDRYTIRDHARMITEHIQGIVDLELNKQPPLG